MDILKDLRKRNILNNITNEDKFNNIPKGSGVYIGFDPTATSLHLGNYIQISILLRFKKYGFKPYAILGGATGMIGDPSGKSEERNLLDNKTLLNNKSKIKSQLESFGLAVVDNYDFYKNMNVLDFLRDAGKLMNINYMINKETVSSRMETGISFTEFAYQLIQGWDFKTLYEEKDVMIQMGGSDQWGNITTGIEMIRKVIGDKNLAVGITSNLLTTASGHKFGKSAGNAIWIDKELSSPYQLYQYLLNIEDKDVKTLLEWVTFIPLEKIEEVMEEHLKQPWLRIAQKKLAFEIIKDIHSLDDANTAIKISSTLFGKDDFHLSDNDILQLEGSIPSIETELENILDILVASNAAQSRREAREFIESRGIYLNGVLIDNYEFNLSKKINLLKKGKKSYFIIKRK